MLQQQYHITLESDPVHESHVDPRKIQDAIAWGADAAKLAFTNSEPTARIRLGERIQQTFEEENRRIHEDGEYDPDDFHTAHLSYCLERPVWKSSDDGQKTPTCRMLVLSEGIVVEGLGAKKAEVVDSFTLVLDPATRKIVNVMD